MADPALTVEKQTVYGIQEIQRILPHRYPFLLVDRVIEFESDKRIVALKNVTINEPYFQGHFPGAPVMPGVLIIECMAQAAGILVHAEVPDRARKLIYLTGIENAKFRRPVVPGDQLRVELEMAGRRNHFGKVRGRTYVEGKLVAEADILFAVVDHPAK